jgi:hypothetical protein
MDENVVAHAFHHNAFLIVSNGHRARYGSITSEWDHFAEWKRLDEGDKGAVEAEVRHRRRRGQSQPTILQPFLAGTRQTCNGPDRPALAKQMQDLCAGLSGQRVHTDQYA